MKKICNGHFMSPFNTEDKTFRIMRLTFIALFVFSFSLLASVHSQTMRVNINANNESTHSILEQIEQQTDYLFIYNTYLQPIITQYFIDNKSEIWLLFLIAHSKR